MTTKCPYCGCTDDCPHWLGWTEDGRTIGDPKQGRSAMCDAEPIASTDRIVTTGVSVRVYRQRGE